MNPKKIISVLLGILIISVICFIALWSMHQAHHRKTVALANNALAKYSALLNITTPLRFKQLLPVVENIDEARQAFNEDSKSILTINTQHDTTLKAELDKSYNTTIEKLFLPLLANYYERAMIKNLKNPAMLYPFLNAYMMLTQPKALDNNTLLATANLIIPEAHQADFKKYLLLATQAPFQGLAEDKAIVNAARENFAVLPLDQQAVIVLLNENADSTDVFTSLTWFSPATVKAPVIYTKTGFNNVVNTLLPFATNSVLFGNLALGLRQNTSINPTDLSKLAYNLYLTQYANYWNGLILGLEIKSINNLNDLNKMLDNFGSNQSELTEIITTIHDNTDMPQINYSNKALQAINNLFDTNSQTLAALQFKFADTDNQLHNFSKTDRIRWVNQAIEIANYNPIKLDMALPSPLDRWLDEVSQQYWQINLNTVLEDINQLWQTQIYAFYQKNFFEHFPFAASEFPDADLESFTEFFKPQGILDTFIQQNLNNFINKKQPSWTFRQFPGFNPSNNNDTVVTLQKLQAITQMFFNNTEHPTLQFSLAPILMTPNIKQVSVIFNRIALNANQSSPNVDIPITWQLSQRDKISLQFLDDNNQVVNFSKTGTWAWLRILADNKVQAVDPTNYDLQFNSGILQAQYKLKTDNSVNPFELSVMSSLVVPKRFF